MRIFLRPIYIISEVVYAPLENAGSAGRWDARPGRLHLRHQELQVQGGGDQAHQQGKEHHHHLYRWRDQQWMFLAQGLRVSSLL